MRTVTTLRSVLCVTAGLLTGCTGVNQVFTPFTSNAAFLTCGQTAVVVETGKTVTVNFNYVDEASAEIESPSVQFTLESDPPVADMGRIAQTGKYTASYTAPSSAAENLTVTATATTADTGAVSAVCKIRIPQTGAIGVVDDQETRGLVGSVHQLPPNTPRLPTDLEDRTPLLAVVVPNLDIPTRSFDLGFPSIPDLFEWFAIAFRGRIIIPESRTYYFQVTSDDGANLYIDGDMVVDNDGTHAPRARSGSVALDAGVHEFAVDYFQGPRYHIALQVFWRTDPADPWVIIPPEALDRP